MPRGEAGRDTRVEQPQALREHEVVHADHLPADPLKVEPPPRADAPPLGGR